MGLLVTNLGASVILERTSSLAHECLKVLSGLYQLTAIFAIQAATLPHPLVPTVVDDEVVVCEVELVEVGGTVVDDDEVVLDEIDELPPLEPLARALFIAASYLSLAYACNTFFF